MANKKIYELEELTTPVSNDLLLINQSSTSKDKKVKMSNLVSNDTIESAVDAWLDAHPEATTTVEDGSITPAKFAQSTLDMFDEKANVDGYYEDMAVGSAEQLLSNIFETDKSPYLYRTSGGSLEIGDRVYEDAIVGGSVAWNQLVENGNFASSTGWTAYYSSISVANNVCTLTPQNNINCRVQHSLVTITNHKYLLMAMIKPSKSTSVIWSADNSAIQGLTAISTSANVWNSYNSIANASAVSANFNLFVNRGTTLTSEDTVEIKNVQIFDLTLAFTNPAIADYAYSLEQATAGSGIAWLKSQGFFTKDYYAYSAGGIESVKTSAFKTVGFNQWNEVWEVGDINESGVNTPGSNNIRSKDYIPIFPNTQYYLHIGSDVNMRYYYYDENKTCINNRGGYKYADGKNTTTTSPDGARYMRFKMLQAYGTTYKNDICINLHWDGERDGQYEEYKEHTYPLDNVDLLGKPMLDANNNLYYYGNTYESDGTGNDYFDIVDLGTLNWGRSSTGVEGQYRFNTSGIASAVKIVASNVVANIITAKYVAVKGDTGWATVIDKVVWIDHLGAINIIDNSYTDKDTFKTAMSGVYLVFEKATPTTRQLTPFTSPQIVDNWGTEEFVDERTVPIPVGHETKYIPDLKAKLESAPNNPSTNGLYFLQYQNGEATYVPVPSEVPQTPSEDGTYVLKATVSGGTATLSWVAEE